MEMDAKCIVDMVLVEREFIELGPDNLLPFVHEVSYTISASTC